MSVFKTHSLKSEPLIILSIMFLTSPSQYEWPLSVIRPQQVASVCPHDVEVAVHVMELAVLHVVHVHLVFRHRHLRSVEYGWFIHVVPGEHVLKVFTR